MRRRLLDRYGELMTAGELAELLRYRNALTLKRAIASDRVPLQLVKVGRKDVIPTEKVAQYLAGLGAEDGPEVSEP